MTFTLDIDDGKDDEAPIVLRPITWYSATMTAFRLPINSKRAGDFVQIQQIGTHFIVIVIIGVNLYAESYLITNDVELEKLLRRLEQ